MNHEDHKMKMKNLYVTKLADVGKAEEDRVTFVASTNTEDRYGDIINQRGWKLDSYRSNPIVLLNHNSMELPIGKGDVDVVNGQLMIEIQFDMKDKRAAEIARKTNEGYINAVSVGFNSSDSVYRSSLPKDSPYYNEKGVYFKSAELLEVSIVTIPANPHAIAAKSAIPNIPLDIQKNIAHLIAKHIISTIEEDNKIIITYAKEKMEEEQEEIEEQEQIEEGYGKEKEEMEKTFNMALLAEILTLKQDQ